MCKLWQDNQSLIHHDSQSFDPFFVSNGNNLTNSGWIYLKFTTLCCYMYSYNLLEADSLILLSMWRNHLPMFFQDLSVQIWWALSHISHVRWHWCDVDVPYLRTYPLSFTSRLPTFNCSVLWIDSPIFNFQILSYQVILSYLGSFWCLVLYTKL